MLRYFIKKPKIRKSTNADTYSQQKKNIFQDSVTFHLTNFHSPIHDDLRT